MAVSPRLLVIDPSIAWPENEGVEEIVRGWRGEHRVARPALTPGDGPAPGDGYDADGVVVMGSRASVLDGHPWLHALRGWLGPLVRGEVRRPVLGICFGHQLVAHIAGGEIGRVHLDGAEERGIQESFFEPCRLVPGPATLHVVCSHTEQVRVVPAGFRVVARRARVPVDALEHERLPVHSVQFHPEARRSFLERRGMEARAGDDAAFEEQARLLDEFRSLVLEDAARGDR